MSGLTRSSSNHRPSSSQSVGQRYRSPGTFATGNQQQTSSSSNNATPTNADSTLGPATASNVSRSGFSSQQRANFYGGRDSTTALSTNTILHQQNANEFVSLHEFQALKRQLDRERSQREESITQLREELYELKEARRRERLDSNMYTSCHYQQTANNNNNNNNNNNTSVSNSNNSSGVNLGGGGAGSGDIHARFYQNFINSNAAHPLDNSILGRLNRVEYYQSTALQQQLEALEERVRSRMEDKSRSSTEFSRAEQNKLTEKIESISSTVNNLKSEIVTSRLPAIEGKIAEVSSLANKNSNQIEVLNTHRIHDLENASRLQQEIQSIHTDIKTLESTVENTRTSLGTQQSSLDNVSHVAENAKSAADKAQNSADRAIEKAEAAHTHADRGIENAVRDLSAAQQQFAQQQSDSARNFKSAVDEHYVQNEIDRRVTRSQEENKEYFQARLELFETKLQDGAAASKEHMHHLSEKIDSIESRTSSSIEQRYTQLETAIGNRNDEAVKNLETKMDQRFSDYNSRNEQLVTDLKANLDAKITDRVNCTRDEIVDDYSAQIANVEDRVVSITSEFENAHQSQSTVIRSLLNAFEGTNAVAGQVLDGIEHYIRDTLANSSSSSSSSSNPETSAAAAASKAAFASVLERISGAKQEENGITVGDALKILYQLERGQITNLSQMREEISDLRVHIGLVGNGGGGVSAGSPGRHHHHGTVEK